MANDAQMQQFADQRVRVRAEQIRALVLAMQADKQSIADVYDRAANGDPWDDARTDGPPVLLDEQSHLKFNAFIDSAITALTGHGEYANVMAMCVRPVSGS